MNNSDLWLQPACHTISKPSLDAIRAQDTGRKYYHLRLHRVWSHLMFSFLFLAVLVSHARGGEPLRKKLGQMIMLGFVGQTIPDSLLADLSTRNLGGIILSTGNGNMVSRAQIEQLITNIKNSSQTPPFIAVDQEGGMVARLNASDGFASTYTAFQLGTTFASLDSTRAEASLMASWLKTCGFNLNFAPVADVDVNPVSPAIGYYGRSFSADPMTVAAHDQVFVDEFHNQNIITSLKHFPGHGSASTDSHLTLPDITHTWSSAELTPYRQLMQTNSVDMVMIGHLYNAFLDSVYPASLSHSTVQGLLRDSLHFGGVVITDDLYNMQAITDNFGFWDAAEHSINAGVDILLYVDNTLNGASLCRQLVDTLESKVNRGLIAESRIDEAYSRILQLKNRYTIAGVPAPLASRHAMPNTYSLTNYPNPFNPSTTIHFSLPVAEKLILKIYDLLGREVETLFDGTLSAGTHEMRWNAGTHASGLYYCRLQTANTVATTKLILLK